MHFPQKIEKINAKMLVLIGRFLTFSKCLSKYSPSSNKIHFQESIICTFLPPSKFDSL